MTPEQANNALESPLRLVLIAELLERHSLSLEEAVLTSGRHEQDVRACLRPLVGLHVLVEDDGGFALAPDLDASTREALTAGVARASGRLERDRFVRAHVMRGMIGVDPKMQLVFEAIRQVCRLDVAVLVLGETGTGKELVARAIHELGSRHGRSFEAVNCATLPTALFESHVFGHARGAFTGATQEHVGVVEKSDGGTLFLDEIGELELLNQAKLLRVLQDRTFQRLGETTVRKSAFRLVAATHRDLPAMVRAGTFREDLYYRCNVFTIRIPSLRERVDDLPHIVDDLLRASATQLQLDAAPKVQRAALDLLRRHTWPGNVRELENVLIRAAIASAGGPIGPEHVRIDSEANEQAPPSVPALAVAARPRTLAEAEHDHVAAVFALAKGNVRAAAEILDIPRSRLYRKLREYGIER